ncbi:NTP transferase domain-containing protein [Propionibacterium freudenreichii]|uniref:NTP transferase domain-containing protein n=1 Tax=Propionibacterium freudenreichii TaxID=1744 RepID=UPI00345DF204
MSTHSERTAPQRSSDATAVPRVAAVIVLAAGEGTRMKSRTSKILHEVAGESMISSALRAAAALEPQRLVVVVGHQRAQVEEHLAEVAPRQPSPCRNSRTAPVMRCASGWMHCPPT